MKKKPDTAHYEMWLDGKIWQRFYDPKLEVVLWTMVEDLLDWPDKKEHKSASVSIWF